MLCKLFVKSLMKDKRRVGHLIIVYALTIALSLVFCELSYNPAFKNDVANNVILFTPITMFISLLDIIVFIIVSLGGVLIGQIYKTFLESHYNDFSIYEILGCALEKLSLLMGIWFLCFSILVTPLAWGIGYVLIVCVHKLLFSLFELSVLKLSISLEAFGASFAIGLVMLFSILLYTIGFFYRKDPLTIMKKDLKTNTKPVNSFLSIKIYFFSLILSFLILIVYKADIAVISTSALLIFLTLAGFSKFYTNKYIMCMLKKDDLLNTISKSFCRIMINSSSSLILLFQVSFIIYNIILINMRNYSPDLIIVVIASLISYFMLLYNLTYKMKINFKSHCLKQYQRLGVSKKLLIDSVNKSLIIVFLFIFTVPFIFQLVIFSYNYNQLGILGLGGIVLIIIEVIICLIFMLTVKKSIVIKNERR